MFELSEARRDELVEDWATRIVDRGLSTAAVFLLEAHKPLAGIGAHVALGIKPIIESLIRVDAAELAAFLRDPENVERLIARVEKLDRQRRKHREDNGTAGRS